MTSLAVGGSTVGSQILATGLGMAGAAAAGAKFAAKPSDTAPTAQSQSFVDYSYAPIFGADFVSCNTSPPPSPPSTTVIFVHPDGTTTTVTNDSHQIVVAPK